jgi:L-alanine-DL-glutamate epimerase-like enolase superfamily enzyme
MKISRAKIYLVNIGGRHPILVELFTDEGLTGVGEAAVAYGLGGTAAAGMIKDLAAQCVLGRDPFNVEAIWHEMYPTFRGSRGAVSDLIPQQMRRFQPDRLHRVDHFGSWVHCFRHGV